VVGSGWEAVEVEEGVLDFRDGEERLMGVGLVVVGEGDHLYALRMEVEAEGSGPFEMGLMMMVAAAAAVVVMGEHYSEYSVTNLDDDVLRLGLEEVAQEQKQEIHWHCLL
jgi:hypothetical protein